jgi:hypothetical protein
MDDPFDMLIKSLRGAISPLSCGYHTREEAYETLKRVTGEDHGYDTDAWLHCRDKFNNRFDDLRESLPPLRKEQIDAMWSSFQETMRRSKSQ